MTKTCKICGREFEPKAPNGLYCSAECRKKQHRLDYENWKRRYNSEYRRHLIKKRRGPGNHKEFAEISARCAELGISYGEAVARGLIKD